MSNESSVGLREKSVGLRGDWIASITNVAPTAATTLTMAALIAASGLASHSPGITAPTWSWFTTSRSPGGSTGLIAGVVIATFLLGGWDSPSTWAMSRSGSETRDVRC